MAGDAVYNDVHLYLAESNAQTRREWIDALGRRLGHRKGRNVYFHFGHKADLFQNSAFKTLFLNAIRWASAS